MATTQGTAGNNGQDDGNTRPSAAQWSDLPDDLLGNIRLRIAYQRDRARLAAVCRPWRAALARIPAPAAAPLLLLSPDGRSSVTKYLCDGGQDGWCVLPVTHKAANRWLVGSHDRGWVAAFDFNTREPVLLNLFSDEEIRVSSGDLWDDVWRNPISSHVVFSDDPTSSSGCILATITNRMQNIALCKVGCRSGWIRHGRERRIFTCIAFCNGDLYALTYPGDELVKFEIDTMEDGSPVVKSTHHMAIQRRHGPTVNDEGTVMYERYILELHGKPSIAVMTRWLPNRDPFFKVFEIVKTDPGEIYQHKWVEVTSFGDYALFLGPASSKAVHVPVGSERRGFERNHIYYSMVTSSKASTLRGDEVYSLRLNDGRLIYCRDEQCVGDGLERTGYFMTGCVDAPMWIYPPDL